MFGYIFFSFTSLSLFPYYILWPIIDYYRDRKVLRKYPNLNVLSGITDLGFTYEAHKNFRSEALLKAHQKHPIVRTGPNSLSFSDVAAIKDIYGHNTKCLKEVFYNTLAGTHHHLADATDKLDHQRKRRIMSSTYALKDIEGWEHKVADKTARFIKAADVLSTQSLKKGTIPSSEDLTFDYRAYSNFFTLDAIADIGLSERLNFLDQGHDLVTAETMSGKLYKVNYRATQRLARYRAGEKLDDFFSALMEDKNGNPNRMEWGEIVAEISIMMNARSDTTAIAMNAMYLLLRNPKYLEKLRAEIDAVVDRDEVVIPYDKVRHLPYLRACLDEASRLLPPTTFGLPRGTPEEGAPILGEFVPGNTSRLLWVIWLVTNTSSTL